ncbi:porphobilinogen deaminase [Aureococcus anophagefferens]|nr:porphobilinogen deaminase [Aureococcus anophagefferens]
MPTPAPSTLPTSSPYYIGEVGTAITLCMGCSESTDPVGRRTTAIADANIGAPPGIDDDDGEDTIEYLEAHFVEALEQGDVLDALAWTMGTCLNGTYSADTISTMSPGGVEDMLKHVIKTLKTSLITGDFQAAWEKSIVEVFHPRVFSALTGKEVAALIATSSSIALIDKLSSVEEVTFKHYEKPSPLPTSNPTISALPTYEPTVKPSQLVRISSTGEYRNNTPLPLALDPTVDFTGLLDDAVGSGAVDVAVHSLKDLPPANRWRGDLRVACHLPRTESAADALVGYASMDLVPRGARVGTASQRRRALLRCARPDLDVVTVRGNVHARLETLDRGDVDALILGAAGLQRLELLDARRHAILSFDEMLPAPAQGIVGPPRRRRRLGDLLARADDGGDSGALDDLLARVDDRDARIAATAERGARRRRRGVAGHRAAADVGRDDARRRRVAPESAADSARRFEERGDDEHRRSRPAGDGSAARVRRRGPELLRRAGVPASSRSTAEDAAAYFAEAWWPSGRGGVDCEVVAGRDADVYAYQCACGNGFWCGANTALPKFCPKGYFCETPASLEKCPEGSYCKEGSVEAAKCSNLQDCPKGSAVPEATASARRRPAARVGQDARRDPDGVHEAARARAKHRSGLFIFLLLTLLSYVVFRLRNRLRAKALEKGNMEVDDYNAILDERSTAEDEVPTPFGGDQTSVELSPVSKADVLREDFVDYPRDVARAFCPSRGDPKRPTISPVACFALCLRRACRQAYGSFYSFFLGVVVFYFAVGQFIASLVGDGLNVLGGYSPDVCMQQYPELQAACLNLQESTYVPAISAVVFIVVAMGASTSASTFGCERAQYWREAAAGLHTPAYFFAKVAADVPLCMFSGAGGKSMSEEPDLKWIFAMSAPRWFLEAVFYATTVDPFDEVPSGPNEGEPYFDLSRQKQAYRYFNTYWDCIGWLFFVNLCLLVIDLLLITGTKLEKKR